MDTQDEENASNLSIGFQMALYWANVDPDNIDYTPPTTQRANKGRTANYQPVFTAPELWTEEMHKNVILTPLTKSVEAHIHPQKVRTILHYASRWSMYP